MPRVTVRAGSFDSAAHMVSAAFERRLGTPPWLLRRLQLGEAPVLELDLVDRSWRPPRNGRWIGAAELEGLRLADEEHRPLLAAYLGEPEVPAERPPWSRPGWREPVVAWLDEQARRLGRRLLAVEQVRVWSISAVLRARTDGPTLYLKAPARLPLFVDEARVTAELAGRFPGYVPAPLAVEPDEGWLLLAELDLVGWQAPLDVRAELFRRFAGLQRRSAELTDELLAAGCLDRRLHALEAQLDPLFADERALSRLEPDETAELRRRADELRGACRRLAECGLPDTLVHGDLHPGNVARQDGELVYFDWTDACVAQPLVDLHSLQWSQDESVRAALLEAYLEGWGGDVPPEAVRLARVVTPLHHAVSYATIAASLEPVSKPELDATHDFLREAVARVREL